MFLYVYVDNMLLIFSISLAGQLVQLAATATVT